MIIYLFLLGDNCFTMLWWSLPHIMVNQSHYICIFPPSWTSLPPPIPPLYVITEYQAGLPVLQSSFPTVIDFTHDSGCMQCYFLSLSQPLLALLCPSKFLYLYVSISSVKYIHQYHFSRFHTYAFIYDTCFSLTYFTLYNKL